MPARALRLAEQGQEGVHALGTEARRVAAARTRVRLQRRAQFRVLKSALASTLRGILRLFRTLALTLYCLTGNILGSTPGSILKQ